MLLHDQDGLALVIDRNKLTKKGKAQAIILSPNSDIRTLLIYCRLRLRRRHAGLAAPRLRLIRPSLRMGCSRISPSLKPFWD